MRILRLYIDFLKYLIEIFTWLFLCILISFLYYVVLGALIHVFGVNIDVDTFSTLSVLLFLFVFLPIFLIII